MKRFHYRDIEDLERECETLEIEIPIGSSVEILKTPVRIKSREIANRLAIHPMEGSDAEIRHTRSCLVSWARRCV